ncbi:MAG: hypothetical protein ACON5B_03750 [Myxococcota bacterium]
MWQQLRAYGWRLIWLLPCLTLLVGGAIGLGLGLLVGLFAVWRHPGARWRWLGLSPVYLACGLLADLLQKVSLDAVRPVDTLTGASAAVMALHGLGALAWALAWGAIALSGAIGGLMLREAHHVGPAALPARRLEAPQSGLMNRAGQISRAIVFLGLGALAGAVWVWGMLSTPQAWPAAWLPTLYNVFGWALDWGRSLVVIGLGWTVLQALRKARWLGGHDVRSSSEGTGPVVFNDPQAPPSMSVEAFLERPVRDVMAAVTPEMSQAGSDTAPRVVSTRILGEVIQDHLLDSERSSIVVMDGDQVVGVLRAVDVLAALGPMQHSRADNDGDSGIAGADGADGRAPSGDGCESL